MEQIRDRILKLEQIEWRGLRDLQPPDLKHVANSDHIRQSILKNGFAFPFAVWQDPAGDIYAIDGHTRKDILQDMYNVPETLPAFFIAADDREDAIRILLEVYNQRHNEINPVVLTEWLQVEAIAVETVNVGSLNAGSSEAGVYDNEDFSTDFSLPDGDKEPFQQMTFTLADEQATVIQNAIADIKQTEEYKYVETMGNENSNGNALYLIVASWAGQRI